jgi:hypothetical protein
MKYFLGGMTETSIINNFIDPWVIGQVEKDKESSYLMGFALFGPNFKLYSKELKDQIFQIASKNKSFARGIADAFKAISFQLDGANRAYILQFIDSNKNIKKAFHGKSYNLLTRVLRKLFHSKEHKTG